MAKVVVEFSTVEMACNGPVAGSLRRSRIPASNYSSSGGTQLKSTARAVTQGPGAPSQPCTRSGSPENSDFAGGTGADSL
jgi:hypothetical protein